ncbi:hypothetical protein BT93_A1762 [Corymbia citriodora subsp. variegata]|nr:hypothetical protein BT93_A1762 [Corymbia citriodora subsp. variegata]
MGSVEPEQQPLLLRLDHNGLISDLSSATIKELLEHSVPLRWWARLVAWESRVLWLLSGSSIVVSVFNYMLSFVSLMFAGHLGAEELAGASIATVCLQGLAYGIMLGMASAVQTVCGQAYGAKWYSQMGIICQRAMVLHLGAAVLLTFIYWFSGNILLAIGESETITEPDQLFTRGMIPQLFAFALACPMQRFLQAQNIVNPLAYMSVGVFLLHTLLTWIVVYVLDYGLLGAALTLSLSWWILPLLQGNLDWPVVRALKGVWPYFKLTVASAVMLCWFPLQSTIELDTMSICMNYWNWDMQFMLGLSAAASIQVGNELGAVHPRVAKFSVVVNATSILISIMFTAIVLTFRVGLSKLFTSDEEVIMLFLKVTPLLAISVFLNGIQPILSGVEIGSGWQAVVAYVNLTAYYIIGLPIGCVLGFKTGIWWGMIIGVILQTATLIIFTA